jgi:GTP-binding protein HflX
MWSHLDTITGAAGGPAAGAVGGIGTRGTGEKQLEIDRRIVSKRITELKRELADIDSRKVREIETRKGMFKICLVGYTNAGKSTLLNKLTGPGKLEAYVDNRLFATLDPITRKTYAPTLGREVLVTDTVGFIDRLPTELVAAFRATLEEAVFADLLVVVVDGSEPDWERKLDVVEKTLNEIGAGNIQRVLVFSKCDLYAVHVHVENPDEIAIDTRSVTNGLRVSGVTGEGIDEFWEEVADMLKVEY